MRTKLAHVSNVAAITECAGEAVTSSNESSGIDNQKPSPQNTAWRNMTYLIWFHFHIPQ
jgi:hypothetical protein